MSNKPILPFVEMMVTQACNIACTGCTNYSDLAHKGYLTWEQGKKEIESWLKRVNISDFGIIGGEPLMNPDIQNWIKGLRDIMPNTQIRFTTNGLLLEKHLDILDLCYDVGNVVFKITKHLDDTKLDKLVQDIFNKFNWESVVEFGINRWRTNNDLRLQINNPAVFVKTFVGEYHNMKPHNSNPVEAFKICCQKTCPLIYQGNLHKCSTTALLKDVLLRFNQPNWAEWEKYLYKGLSPDCSEYDLSNFIQNFGQPHSMCSQCPTKQDTKSHLVHFNNVSFKKYA